MKKKLLGIATALTIGLSGLGGTAQAGEFDSLDVPQIIPNTYKKATESADASKNIFKKEDASDSQKTAQKKKDNINDKMKEVFDAAGWTAPTLIVGQISGSVFDAFGATNSTVNLSTDEQASWKARGVDMTSYQAFGEGLTNLRSQSWDRSTSELSVGAVSDGATEGATALSTAGLKFLQKFNPAPVVAAFYNDSYLNDARFGGGNNKLVQIVNSNQHLKEAVTFFGAPTGAGISLGWLITATLIIARIAYSCLYILFGNMRHNSPGMVMRWSIWKIVVAAIGIPLGAMLLSEGLATFNDVLNDKQKYADNKILSQNLNFADWYNSNFEIPAGTTISVDDNGKFKMSPEAISAINYKSSRKVIGNDSSSTEEIANRMVDMAQKDGNRTTIVFNSIFKDNEKVAKAPFIKFAESLTSTAKEKPKEEKKEEEKDGDKKEGDDKKEEKKQEQPQEEKKEDKKPIEELKQSPYITTQGVQANGREFTGTGNGGMSTLAAYNFMVTDFTKNGAKVRTNVGQVDFPSIAIGLSDEVVDAKGSTQAPTLIRLIALFTVMTTAVQVMVGIISTGFGALFKGGGGTALGSSRGFGELIGGVIAITLGVFGLSLILQLTLVMIDILWDVLAGIFWSDDLDIVGETLKPITDKVREIWLIGGILAGLMKSLASFIVTAMVAMALPRMLKIPVQGYGAWIQGIPDTLGEKMQLWENNWTGDYQAGRTNMSKIGQNTKIGERMRHERSERQSHKREKQKERGKQVKAGLGMAAAAAATSIGSKIAGINPADTSMAQDPSSIDQSTEVNEGGTQNSQTGDSKQVNQAESTENMTNNEHGLSQENTESVMNNDQHDMVENSQNVESLNPDGAGSHELSGAEAGAIAGAGIMGATMMNDNRQTNDSKSISQQASHSHTTEGNSSQTNNQQDGNAKIDNKNLQTQNSEAKSVSNISRGGNRESTQLNTGNTNASNKSVATSQSNTKSNTTNTGQAKAQGAQGAKATKAPAERKAPGRFRQAVGKGLMNYGGHTTGKQAMAGLKHAAASSVGMGRFTQHQAQSAVEERNEALVANGMRVSDNLNFMGPGNREQSERRAEAKLKSRGIIQSNGQFTAQHQARLDRQGSRSTYKAMANNDRRFTPATNAPQPSARTTTKTTQTHSERASSTTRTTRK